MQLFVVNQIVISTIKIKILPWTLLNFWIRILINQELWMDHDIMILIVSSFDFLIGQLIKFLKFKYVG